jgi:hypothetical protein
MTALDFPNNPIEGDTYSASGKVWMYNGYGWDVLSSGGGNPLSLNAESPITYNALTSTVGFDEAALIVDGGNA